MEQNPEYEWAKNDANGGALRAKLAKIDAALTPFMLDFVVQEARVLRLRHSVEDWGRDVSTFVSTLRPLVDDLAEFVRTLLTMHATRTRRAVT